ncbi:MAG: Rieske (2Fe-2S) protein [Flammeovirgaceae bacterium]
MKWLKVFNTLEEAEKVVPMRSSRLILAGNRKICLSHAVAGFFAVDDACPHLGESLSKGTVNFLGEVICPWHSFRYNLKNGLECENRTRKVQTYPIKVDETGFYVGVPES